MTTVQISTPASSANLGPGFDCLGLALSLWNKARFTLNENNLAPGIHFAISGEGHAVLPADQRNLVVRAMQRVYQRAEQSFPTQLSITCENNIPLSSGLGSSAAAVVTGLLGANALLGSPFSKTEMLEMAVELEGHPDNVSPAMLGGLTISTGSATHRISIPTIKAVVILPDFDLPTAKARMVLPQRTLMTDAVFNLGHTALVVEALRDRDMHLLLQGMEDRLHQPARLRLIPGAADAIAAARSLGAAAVLSGAGPAVIAFHTGRAKPIVEAMQATFRHVALTSRVYELQSSAKGAIVKKLDA